VAVSATGPHAAVSTGVGLESDPGWPRRAVVPAPAKVNLFLHVTGRRPDGYHTLESLFTLVDLADTITLALRDDGAIVREGDVPGVAAEDDLALRAARRLREATGCRPGVAIAIDKAIPLGAGLGGGSSDAAAVLLALNRMWDLGLSRAALIDLAATLGADVPFFVFGETALARGVGERLTAMTAPRTSLVLAFPDAQVSTAAIFASPELTRTTPPAKIDVFSESYGRNDLSEACCARTPAVARALAAMKRVSPQARMTGSGACVFAAFASERDAQDAARTLPEELKVRVVRTLSRHPLAAFA
jgi:4-diphosphocytidyl-2-C-methyl-D-erythritol kinase